MGAPRRLPWWLLVVATGAICATTLQLEGADLFPLWRLALQWSPSALPSTGAVPSVEILNGLPTLSLAVEESDLHSPDNGILANARRHGPDWERKGSVSYFEGGRLVFASGVGVRNHGASGGPTSERPPSFRLYFRRRYGAREFAPGILFGPEAQPIRRLIVHNDVRRDPQDVSDWHLVNPLAYDIAKAMGAIAPDTKPVRFFLNGKYYGVYVLSERFDKRFFAAHWGYDDIQGYDDFLVDESALDELWAWANRTRPLTMEAVAKQVDLENLTRWFLAVAFSATRDTYQWPGQFLDLTREQGRWFWVNWDMDRSFRNWDLDMYLYLLERIEEPLRGPYPSHPRAPILVSRLLAEDAAYRDYFKRIFLEVMNHRVTDAFLEERYRHYLDVATELRVEHLDYLPRLREFLERRPAFFRRITEQWLNSPPSQPLTLVAPDGVSLVIDGERVKGGYQGLYLPDLDLSLEVPTEHRARFSGWRLNGRLVAETAQLTLRVEGPARVEALFDEPRPVSVLADVPDPAKVVPSVLPRPVWRRIPAGSFWMGCVPTDRRCGPDELPRRQTRIGEPFDMMDREVAASDFQAFAAATGRQMPRQPDWYADPTHPVVNLTWDEAQAYCEWVGGRLPTEAEWEYAARGGLEGRLFPWGNEFSGKGNAGGTVGADPWEFTAPVGSFEPNRFGLRDMAGNVWEWTASLYRPSYDTVVEDNGYELRTIRGGSWDSSADRLRNSERTALSRQGRHNLYVGFRCVR